MTAPEPPGPLAGPDDVAAVWRPLSDDDATRVTTLIAKASAKLRHACPFDVDARIALFSTDPTNTMALDPDVVADVVATVVKRFLVNVDGVASSSRAVGPFSRSATYVNRYDKTGSDVRGAIQITDSDIDQLRPAIPAEVPSVAHVQIPDPQLLVPVVVTSAGVGSAVVPDLYAGRGAE